MIFFTQERCNELKCFYVTVTDNLWIHRWNRWSPRLAHVLRLHSLAADSRVVTSWAIKDPVRNKSRNTTSPFVFLERSRSSTKGTTEYQGALERHSGKTTGIIRH